VSKLRTTPDAPRKDRAKADDPAPVEITFYRSEDLLLGLCRHWGIDGIYHTPPYGRGADFSQAGDDSCEISRLLACGWDGERGNRGPWIGLHLVQGDPTRGGLR